MADVDIEVDSGDLKAVIQMLEGYEDSFVKMVNTVQTESNRMNRATKASADQIQTALDRMNKSASSGILADMLRKEQTEFVAMQKEISNAIDYWQKYDSQIGVTGKSASELGATFDKLGTILDQQEKQTRDYWDSFNQSIGNTDDKATELGATFSKLGDIIEKQAKQSKDYWDNFNKSLGIGSSATNAGAGFSALEKEIQTLTSKYAPLTAAAQYYEKEVLGIKRAHDLGLSSAKEMSFQLQNLEREYQALQKGSYIAGSRFNQFGEMADGSGKAAQRFGLYAQQAGYQIGDFAVQVQNGTNVGVAFSQQAAQLAGLIPGVAGAVTTFAAIGLGLLIQNLTRSEKETKKAKEAYSDLGNTLDRLEGLKFKGITQGLSTAATTARREFENLFKLIEQQELKNLNKIINDPVKNFAKSIEEFKRMQGLQKQIGNDGPAFNVMGFKDIGKAQQALQLLNQIQGTTKEELQENLRLTLNMLKATGSLTDPIRKHIQLLSDQLSITDNINSALKSSSESASKVRDAYSEATQAVAEQIRQQRQSAELQDIAAKYGKDSLNYVYAEKEVKLQNYQLEMELLGLSGSILDQRVRSYEALLDAQIAQQGLVTDTEILYSALYGITGIDLSGVFSRAQAAADGLLSSVNAIGRGLAQLGRLQQQANALKAEKDALASGATPRQAKVAGDTVAYGYSLEGVPNWAKGIMKTVYSSQATEVAEYQDQIAEGTKAYNKSQRGGGSGKKGRGGKSDAEKAQEKAEKAQEKINEKFTDFLNDFALKMEQQERLVGVQGKEREQLEKVIEIENRLGDARTLATDKQIEAWAKEELALQQRLENEKFLYDLGKDSFKSFLDTVITGTASIEDAFKTMLSNIIKEMYDKYVGQYAADVAGNFFMSLFSANGNAFGAGGVKMFAKGGVVDSPTAFRYSGGLGVMGEAGPEAIMPLKRNSQGKLGVQVSGGSNGDVKVTQVFQISANGDESVKQIIKSQMPQIQQAAVQGVIAAKRKNVRGLN